MQKDSAATDEECVRPDSVPRHFQLLSRIAVGRRCEVHLAKTHDGQQVVLKVPLPEHRTSRTLAAEFATQAAISRAFEHEHVVRVLETGTVSGSPYLVMEHVEGENLRSIVERSRAAKTPLEVSVALRLTLQVCRALAAAHATGRPSLRPSAPVARGDVVVHGDLSLENLVLVPSGQVKILPFGCAPPPPSSAVTQPAGQVVPLHLAPEVIAGDLPDPCSDLWSLGSLLYELLAPELPDGFRTARGPMGWWRLGLLPPLDQLRSDVPSEIAHLAAHLLEADPARRLQRAEFVEEELVWALTTHGDRRAPRHGQPPDGEPREDLGDVVTMQDDEEGYEELDLDEAGVVDTMDAPAEEALAPLPDPASSLDPVPSAAVADDMDDAGVIQMVGAPAALGSAFTDTDAEIEPLREVAREEGRSPPLVPDEELWIGADDNPLLSQDPGRATWMELQAWGESHEASVKTEEDFGLDAPVVVDEADDEALWPTVTHVPTIDGLKALDGPAIAAGLRDGTALAPEDYGPESHVPPSMRTPKPEPAPPAQEAAEPPKKKKRKKKKKRRKKQQVAAAPPRARRADVYFLVGSVALFLAALLLFFSVVLG